MKYGGATHLEQHQGNTEKSIKKNYFCRVLEREPHLKKEKYLNHHHRLEQPQKNKTETKIKMLVKKYKNGQTLCGLLGEPRSNQTKKF